MHSYANRYTHDFFFERDYPAVAVLDAMRAQLRPEPMPQAQQVVFAHQPLHALAVQARVPLLKMQDLRPC